jgi:hypothetical protein
VGIEWQTLFDNLLTRKITHAPALVNSSSRAPLNVFTQSVPATVSLPAGKIAFTHRDWTNFKTHHNDFNPNDWLDFQTKSTDEELFPQPEFGSTPKISLPKVAHLAANVATALYPHSRVGIRAQPKEVDVVTKQALVANDNANNVTVRIGTGQAKTVQLAGNVQKRTINTTNEQRGTQGGVRNSYSPRDGQQGAGFAPRNMRGHRGRGGKKPNAGNGSGSWGNRNVSVGMGPIPAGEQW